jgi:hypothetical protein
MAGDAVAVNVNTGDLTYDSDLTGDAATVGTAGSPSASVLTVQGVSSGTAVVVGGNVASAATDSGNPVKVAAKYNSTLPTFTDGQRADLQVGSRGAMRVEIFSPSSTTAPRIGTTSDTYADSNAGMQGIALGMLWNGASWDRSRTPSTFKTVEATSSGDTAVWTPTSTKKFRLMGYSIEVTADAATSGGADLAIVLRDNSTALGCGVTVFIPNAGATTMAGAYNSGQRSLGNGKLSAAADQVLNVNLAAALTAGKVRVNVWGTEE